MWNYHVPSSYELVHTIYGYPASSIAANKILASSWGRGGSPGSRGGSPRRLEAHQTAMEAHAHLGAVEAQYGTLEAHHGGIYHRFLFSYTAITKT
jgi:hypothetical protein